MAQGPALAPLPAGFGRYLDWFSGFVDVYAARLAGDPNIAVKREHSRRVFDEARAILAAEPAPATETFATLLAALFHDVGRFPQYERYRTFRDADSTDHARLSHLTLQREKVLAGLDPAVRRLALGAVVLHNRRSLPPGLAPALARAAGVVRDADKLDIMRVMLAQLAPDAPANAVVTLHLADEPGAYTPALLEGLLAGRLGDYGRMVYVNDFKLLLLSWVHDLSTAAARRAFAERGFVERLFSLLPRTPDMARAAALCAAALKAGEGG